MESGQEKTRPAQFFPQASHDEKYDVHGHNTQLQFQLAEEDRITVEKGID